MRFHSTQDDKIFSAKGQATWLRVDVQDSGGTFRDLTAQRGYNFVVAATWKWDHDTALMTATVNLTREIFGLSLSPDLSTSVLNALGGGTQLLLPNTRIRLYVQLQPSGIAPQSGSWQMVFDGCIDTLNSGPDPMQLDCSDLTVRLQRAYILDDRAYGVWQPGQRYIGSGSSAYLGSSTIGAVVVPQPTDPTFPQNPDAPTGPWLRCTGSTGQAAANSWIASHSYTNATVTPTIPNGFTYTMTGTHTSGSTEPTWPQQAGLTVVDGGVTWTCVQPTAPSWPATIGGTVSDNGLTWTNVGEAGLQAGVPWAASTSYPANSIVTGTVAVSTAVGTVNVTYWFKNKTGSTFSSGSSTPSWSATLGGTVADNGHNWTNVGQMCGTPLETQMQMVLDDNMGAGAWQLYCPLQSYEVCRPYTQSGMNVLQALQNLANINAWDIRYRWADSTPVTLGGTNSAPNTQNWAGAGSSGFFLTFYNPLRASTSSAYTFPPSKYRDVQTVSRDLDTVRNYIKVGWWDGVNVDATGNPVLSYALAQDSGSISKYGKLGAVITPDANTGVNSATTAGNIAAAILSDYGQDPVEVEAELELSWWLDLADVITMQADNLHWNSDQTLAAFSIQHGAAQNGPAISTFTLRGKPSAGHHRWTDLFAVPGGNGAVKQLGGVATRIPNVTSTIAGASIGFTLPSSRERRYATTELHLSTSSGFTANASTFVTKGNAGRFDLAPGGSGGSAIGALQPGTTYKARIIHKDVNGNPYPPSPEFTVTTGYANLAHINPNLVQNLGGFISTSPTFADSSTGFAIAWDHLFFGTSGMLNTSTGVITTLFGNATFLVNIRCLVAGGHSGNGVQATIQFFTGSFWSQIRSFPVVLFNASGNADMCFTAPIQGIAASTQLRIVLVPSGSSGNTLTLNGGTPGSGGNDVPSYFSITQMLL